MDRAGELANQQQRLTRKDFLKLTGFATAAAVSQLCLETLARLMARANRRPVYLSPHHVLKKADADAGAFEGIQKSNTKTLQQLRDTLNMNKLSRFETIQTNATVLQSIPAADRLFKDLSSTTLHTAADRVLEQLLHYGGEPDLSVRIETTRKWKGTVDTIAKDVLPQKDHYLSEILLGMIFVESGGNTKAKTAFAEGVCQVSKEAAEDMGAKGKDLFNPYINIEVALRYIDKLTTVYPDLGVAVWAYHLGQKNMNAAIQTYCIKDLGMNALDVNRKLDNKDPNQRGTKVLIEESKKNFGEKNINVINLLQSPSVISTLKKGNAFNNDTQFYTARVAAGLTFLQQFQSS